MQPQPPLAARVRQSLRAALRGGWYPLLLPHFRVVEGGLSTLGDAPTPMTPAMAAALRLCDGAHTVADVAAAAGVTRQELLEHTDHLLVWHEPVPPARPPDTGKFDLIVISPHLDDAPLSVGALLMSAAARGQRALVVNVFSTVSWWRLPLPDGILPKVQQTRDAEDDLALRLCGAAGRYWGHGEAPLRGYPLKEIFTTARLPEAQETHAQIREQTVALEAEHPAATWLLPLGVGNHVDHRIARDAAIHALHYADVPADNVRFYEDMPYTSKQSTPQDFSTFLEQPWPGTTLALADDLPTTGHHKAKLRMLRAYWSQLHTGHYNAIDRYARTLSRWLPHERLWRRTTPALPANGTRTP